MEKHLDMSQQRQDKPLADSQHQLWPAVSPDDHSSYQHLRNRTALLSAANYQIMRTMKDCGGFFKNMCLLWFRSKMLPQILTSVEGDQIMGCCLHQWWVQQWNVLVGGGASRQWVMLEGLVWECSVPDASFLFYFQTAIVENHFFCCTPMPTLKPADHGLKLHVKINIFSFKFFSSLI